MASYELINDRYGNNSDRFDSVADFLTMCVSVFGGDSPLWNERSGGVIEVLNDDGGPDGEWEDTLVLVETYADVLGQCEELDDAEVWGGVVRVRDGQVTWFGEEGEYDDVMTWDVPKGTAACDVYSAFCNDCTGHVANERAAIPLQARFAQIKYDLVTEGGREGALEDVFHGDADALARACMWLDAQQEGVTL